MPRHWEILNISGTLVDKCPSANILCVVSDSVFNNTHKFLFIYTIIMLTVLIDWGHHTNAHNPKGISWVVVWKSADRDNIL